MQKQGGLSGEAPGDKVIKALSPFHAPLLMPTIKTVGHAWGHGTSSQQPCICLPSSSNHLGLLITALNFLLHPCPLQTNRLGGRILIIIASEKSDCLLLRLPTGHAGSSLSLSPTRSQCLSSMIQTKSLFCLCRELDKADLNVIVGSRSSREAVTCSLNHQLHLGANLACFSYCSDDHQQGALWDFHKTKGV